MLRDNIMRILWKKCDTDTGACRKYILGTQRRLGHSRGDKGGYELVIGFGLLTRSMMNATRDQRRDIPTSSEIAIRAGY
jgi:hypothetical protein